MRSILKYLLVLVSTVSFGQYNLVPNPSFEIFDTCPNTLSQFRFVTGWTIPLFYSTPDYFNECDTINPANSVGVPVNIIGVEPARTGAGYAGVGTYTWYGHPTYFREYIQAELTDSLVASADYCIRFYVSAADSMRYVSNNIGIYFSPVEIHDTCPTGGCYLNYVPQFENLTANLNSRIGWTLVSGNFIASGGEKYIVLGNFRDTVTTIATLTGWSQTPANSIAYYYIDDVLITPCDSLTAIMEHQNNPSLTLSPNPASTTLTFSPQPKTSFTFSVYDYTGIKVIEVKNQTSINVAALPRGLYIAEVRDKDRIMRQKFVKE